MSLYPFLRGVVFRFSVDYSTSDTIPDTEFVQFFPLGFCFPPSLKGALATIPGYTRLRNSKGERFMEKYDPGQMELSTRDRVSPGILTEIKEGRGGPNGGVFADIDDVIGRPYAEACAYRQ